MRKEAIAKTGGRRKKILKVYRNDGGKRGFRMEER